MYAYDGSNGLVLLADNEEDDKSQQSCKFNLFQHVLEHGDLDDKAHIVSELQGKVLMLSQHKFARLANTIEG